ncbi:MAG TPA: carboxypeptidase regulatory-like domain-containing protein [Pyrinomonadaceae bacterium]|nr:carboxypeptidase regulatory-like domain-containing protein [Pyrinomonadaceae bacterium]
MSSSVRFALLLLLTLASVAIPLRAQSPAKTTPAKTARGSVSGRITVKEKPAQGVVVGLRKANTGKIEAFQKATTDPDGLYRITNVAPGTYEVTPAAPAYVVADTNPSRAKNVVVGEGEDVEDINFSMVRGGVITGRVTNADGRPLIQQSVFLYRAGDFTQTQLRQISPAGNTATDDRGVYRFFGLAAGSYKVASGRGDELSTFTFIPGHNNYRQVFHPDVTDQAKATIVEVREGGEAANVDITLGRAVRTFSVNGRIVNGESGEPVANLRFGLQRTSTERLEIVDGGGSSNSRGDFAVDGLMPGRYSMYLVNQNPGLDLRAEGTIFEIVDQDVNGITIRLTKGASVSGTIVLENEDKRAFAKLAEMKLTGYMSPPPGVPMIPQAFTSPIGADGSFRLTGLPPGTVNLNLNDGTGFGESKGFMVSRVENNSVPLLRGIEVKDGDQLTGIRIYVTYGTAVVRGTVNLDRSQAPEGSRMFARLAKVGPPMSAIASAMVDARGHFVFEGIPAGVYEVAVTLMAPGQRMRPQAAKQQITVQDGAAIDVSLTIEFPAPPKP